MTTTIAQGAWQSRPSMLDQPWKLTKPPDWTSALPSASKGLSLPDKGSLGWTRTWQKAQIVAFNVAFLGTLVLTTTGILSLAWQENLLPPKVLAAVIVVAFVVFWVSLVFHFKDVDA